MITKSYITGPKWSGIDTFLFDCAQQTGVDVTIEHRNKMIINETIFYRVEGNDDNIERFKRLVLSGVKNYNKV